MYFANAGDIRIEDAHFERNLQINILLQLTSIVIRNSNFTEGKENLIRADQASITMTGVKMYNSTGLDDQGHGLRCIQCYDLNI